MIKLTHSEQVQRSRLKQKILIEDPTWSTTELKIHLAEAPELWVTKGGKTPTEYDRRLKLIKELWCPKEILKWQRLGKESEKKLKKKD